MAEQDPKVREVTLRRNDGGSLYRTPERKYVLEHEHGPTEVTALELIVYARMVAKALEMLGEKPGKRDGLL